MERKQFFVYMAMLFALIPSVMGCPQLDGMSGSVTVSEYAFLVDKTSCTKYVLTGDGFVRPDNPTITVTNTGNTPLTITAKTVGFDSDCFSVNPPSVSALPAGASYPFTIQFEVDAPDEIYEATVWFESSKDEGKLLKKVYLKYGGIVLEDAAEDITINKWPLQNNESAKVSAENYTSGMPWFSSDSTIARINEKTGEFTTEEEGDVILGYVTNERPFTVRGKTVKVYPAMITLNPQYPLDGDCCARPAGSAIQPVNRAAIQAAAAGSNAVFSIEPATGNVISDIELSTGKLTFNANAAGGETDIVSVDLAIIKNVDEGKLKTHTGSVCFTAKIGAAPKAKFYSAETADADNSSVTVKVDALFTESVTAAGDAKNGFTLKKGAGSLVIETATVTDNRVTLTVSKDTPIMYGDSVTISYSNGSLTSNGQAIDSFANQPVANTLKNVVIEKVTIEGTFNGVRAGTIKFYRDIGLTDLFYTHKIPEGEGNNPTVRSAQWEAELPGSCIGKYLFAVQELSGVRSNTMTIGPVLPLGISGAVLDLKPAGLEFVNVGPWYEKVSVSHFSGSFYPRLAVNGVKGDSGASTDAWRVSSASGASDAWLMVDMGYPVTVSAVRFYEPVGGSVGYIRSFTVQYSDDGTQWKIALDQSTRNGSISIAVGYTGMFDSIVTARYFRFHINQSGQWNNTGLAEFELYYIQAYDRAPLRTALAGTEENLAATYVSDNGEDILAGNLWVTLAVKKAYEQAIAAAKEIVDKLDIDKKSPSAADLQTALDNLVTAGAQFNNAKADGKLVATPVISPAEIFIQPGANVTITSATAGAEIWYTTDGSTPAKNTGSKYNAPFALSSGAVTVKAIAVMDGKVSSSVAKHEYRVVADVYTVTFNSAGGSAVEPQIVGAGELIDKPADPAKTFTYDEILTVITNSGLYPNEGVVTGWFKDGVAWDFDNDLVAGNITLTARWDAAPIADVAQNDMGAALTYANGKNSPFILAINGNVSNGGTEKTNFASGALTIIGLGGVERNITVSSNGSLFRLGSNATVTIGNNITLRGKSGNNQPLVFLEGNVDTTNFVMLNGSKLTGNINTNGASNSGAMDIWVGTLTMRGNAIITGNQNSNSSSSWTCGGVWIRESASGNGRVIMEGDAAITGNTRTGNAGRDFFVGSNGYGALTLSGNAIIGPTVIGTVNSFVITIPAPWGGSMGEWALRGGGPVANKVYVRGTSNYTLTQDDLNRISGGSPGGRAFTLNPSANEAVLAQ